MRKTILRVALLIIPCIPLLSTLTHAQTFTVEGITGIEFDTTGGDNNLDITDNFTLFNLSVTPTSLTLYYTEEDTLLELDGGVELSFDGTTIEAEMYSDITNGVVESIQFEFSSSFELRTLTVAPMNLDFMWKGGTDFAIYGTAVTEFESGSTTFMNAGNFLTPGITISDGTFTSIRMGITSNFETNGLTVSPEDLTFAYSSDNSQYQMYGSATTTVDGNEITLSLGDEDTPGLVFESGSITEVSFGITADFQMKDITISPEELTFAYDSDNSQYEFYGSVNLEFDGEEMSASLGDADSPGIIWADNTIEEINFGLSADFEVDGLSISPDNLTFVYNKNEDYYEIFGDATVTVDGNEIEVSMGDGGTPGFIISSGSITEITLGISADFDIKDITLSPKGLTFQYDATSDYFEMFGSASVTIEGSEIDLSMGDADDPGIIYDDGSLTHINFGITAEFDLKALTLAPDGLTMEYDSGDSRYEFYGAATASLEGSEISLGLGDADSPGFVLSSGTITNVNMSVTGDFDVKAITISPEDLTFIYSSDDDQFEMYGAATTSVDGNDIVVSMGDEDDPGLILDSGSLTHINFGVTADFEMKGITISPDGLTFEYDHSESYYEFYGSGSVKFDGEEIDASLGDADDPGIVFKNGNITHVNFGLTADFKVKSLEISPDDLTFEYDSGEDQFEMYGSITFKIGSDEIASDMGDSDDPGLIYKNNSITHVNIGVTEDFSMSGLKIKTTDLGVEWSSGSDFHMYGDADLSIESETVDTDFGTSSDPGVVIRSGKLHSFNVDINSDIKLGNLEVKNKDLDISYSSEKFEVSGKMEITEVFSLSVTLGEGSQGGLEIDVSGSEPRFKVEALTIQIEHANLGTVDLKNFELKFNSSGIEESDLDVVLPSGTEIDGTIKFAGDPAKIDEISIDYIADNLEEAIEIFEGVQIAYLGASVSNLTHTSDLKVSGTIETIYGGGFSLDGKSATLLEMRDEVTIDKYSFDLNGDVNVGAYRTGTDSWHNLLGEGSIDLYTKFSHYVKGQVEIKIPGDPMVKADATVYMNNDKDFDALVDVTFYVPHSIPFIGGKSLGDVDGAIRYKNDHLSWSYAAAWVRIHTFWHTYHLGAKYNFSSRSISTFSSSGTISDIENDINNDENSKAVSAGSPYVQSIHTFEVYDDPVLPNTLMIDTNWDSETDSVLFTLIGPESIYELTRITTIAENDSTTLPDLGYEENMQWVTNDTSATFLITTPVAFSEEDQVEARLLEGRYQLVISIPADQFYDSVSVDVYPIFQVPNVSTSVSKSDNIFEIDASYWSTYPDSSFISFYANTTASYDSAKLIAHVDAENFDSDGYGNESLTFTADYLSEADTLYFFTVVDDGINPPQNSALTTAFEHTPDLYGTINFPAEADSLEEGLRLYLDADTDSSFDISSTGGLELFGISGQNGAFALSGLSQGTHEVRIVLPPGYRISGTEDRFSATTITYEGDPLELNIEIEAYTEEEDE